ncbi:hypothetical protein [Salmonella phage NINP13076]|nr:hypothetical protein [Salmonella phage NINP13076]
MANRVPLVEDICLHIYNVCQLRKIPIPSCRNWNKGRF